MATAARVRSALPKGIRLVIGSGASAENLGALADVADTVIVGSSLKVDGIASGRLDQERVAAFIEAARHHGLI
jgi:predicted TIM-barrel enzyme